MDKVKITCYGETKEMDRREAKRLFREAMMGCDSGSNEFRRYARIFWQLTEGYKEAGDE